MSEDICHSLDKTRPNKVLRAWTVTIRIALSFADINFRIKRFFGRQVARIGICWTHVETIALLFCPRAIGFGRQWKFGIVGFGVRNVRVGAQRGVGICRLPGVGRSHVSIDGCI